MAKILLVEDEPPNDVESHAGSSADRLCGKERVKDLIDDLG